VAAARQLFLGFVLMVDWVIWRQASCQGFAGILAGDQGEDSPRPATLALFSVPRADRKVDGLARPGCSLRRGAVWWCGSPRILELTMLADDPFSTRYAEFLDGSYDCVDRIVLNGYYLFVQSPGGFRTWWRQVFGSDDNLDNTHLMRFAGRFSRRVRTAAKRRGIPVLDKTPDDRMHEIAAEHRPADPHAQGVFCITVHRAPNSVWGVASDASKHLERKKPAPWVNHYAFHIQDTQWGHVTIKVCPHPPFNVQVILNGHEYVARQAAQKKIPYTKEGNCFTDSSNLAGLEQVAETIRSPAAIGRLARVCERWLYSACLCYLLPAAEQQRTRVRYSWSVYQLEYSRNLLFQSGRIMEEVFETTINRTWRALDIRIIRRIFGRRRRPYRHQGKQPRLEVQIERPTYDLTVFKVHFGLLTLKIYTKGEGVLRIEAIVHNAKKEFARGYSLGHFSEMVEALRLMAQRFLGQLRSVAPCWITDETLNSLPQPSQVGASRVAGVDLNRARIRAVMMAVLASSADPRGFRVEHVVHHVRQIFPDPYTPRQASYDLKKLRGKRLVERIPGTRRYRCPADGLRTITATAVLREKVIQPLLAGIVRRRGRPPQDRDPLDLHYQAVRVAMEKLFHQLGLAV
jgi:hypothetical protein